MFRVVSVLVFFLLAFLPGQAQNQDALPDWVINLIENRIEENGSR